MTVIYGPNPENMALIRLKAAIKVDGVYVFRGVAYRVKGGRVTHIAHDGKVLECCGHFNVQVGTCDIYSSSQIRALKEIQP